jgi:hypothetical protein
LGVEKFTRNSAGTHCGNSGRPERLSGELFNPPLTPEERDVAAVEGRILGAVERHIRRTKQDTLELLRILRDGVPERKSRSGSMALPRSLKHGLKAR